MLRQIVHHLDIQTRGRGFYDFTDQVADVLSKSGLKTGVATLHLQHTSASLLIQENAKDRMQMKLL